MTIALIDVFYVIMIALIFTIMALMELQIKEIKSMMKEHVKFDDKMWKAEKDRIIRDHDKKYPKKPLVK